MARHQPEQLVLPCSLDAEMQLREELTSLRVHLGYLRDELRQAQQDTAALRAQLAQVTGERDFWRNHAHTGDLLLDLAQRGAHRPDPASARSVAQELKKLVAMAHLDRWAQGQSAQVLAHEVAAALNGLRQRLGEGK